MNFFVEEPSMAPEKIVLSQLWLGSSVEPRECSSLGLKIISQVKLAERSKAPDERMVCADRYTKAFTYAFAGSNPALNLELYYSLLFDQKVLWKVQAVFDAWHFNFSSKSKLLLSNNECLGLLLILMDTPLWLEPTARTAFIRETAVIRKKQCSEFFKSFLCTFINITFDNRKTMLRNQNVALIHACFFLSKIEKFVITHFLRLYKSRLIHVHSKYLCH